MSANDEEGSTIVVEETHEMEDKVKHMLEEVNKERIEEKIVAREKAEQESRNIEASLAAAQQEELKQQEEEKPSPRHLRKNALMERYSMTCIAFLQGLFCN
jgi:hypothetical protein